MKIALGLFHFNVQYIAGDIGSYHRYCTEAVIPFLKAVARKSNYRVTFEMAGVGLEFLSENYPGAIDLLRSLIERKQVDLVSSTYAPTIWAAFPGRDLIKSIELNKRCLDRLRLTAVEIFFSQEGFFGPGLTAIRDYFPIALCKDDYWEYFVDEPSPWPAYKLDDLKVIVGANHLMNELRRRHFAADSGKECSILSGFHRKRIESAEGVAAEPTRFVHGKRDEIEWYWYHMGSGHHFTIPASPQDWECFFSDAAWTDLNSSVLDQLIGEGYKLGTVSEFCRRAPTAPAEPTFALMEGSWNAKRSKGIRTWMGQQQNGWENDAGLLGLAWRSRSELRRLEEMIRSISDRRYLTRLTAELEAIWGQQILAESSDPFGWLPLQCETRFGRENAEKVLRLASRLIAEITLLGGVEEIRQPSFELEEERNSRVPGPHVTAELFGARGTLNWASISSRAQLCDVRFEAEELECGVRFPCDANRFTYCPTGLESHPRPLEWEKIKPDELYIPLANGLIGLSPDLFLIRVNRFGQVAVGLRRHEPWLTFSVQGAVPGKPYQWRFVLVRSQMEEAAKLANKINWV